jgi:hypothetical protein
MRLSFALPSHDSSSIICGISFVNLHRCSVNLIRYHYLESLPNNYKDTHCKYHQRALQIRLNYDGCLVKYFLDKSKSVDVMLLNEQDIELRKQIQKQLLIAGILLKDARRHVFFDSEQACLMEHNGDWKRKLAVN